MPDPTGWVTLALAAIVGSTIGGVAGFGTGVIMIPAIAWVVGVKSTVPVLTVCMLLGNSARVSFSRDEIEWRVVSAFLLGAVPMTIVGATLYTHIEGRWLSRMMGAFMILAVPLRRGWRAPASSCGSVTSRSSELSSASCRPSRASSAPS